MSCPLRSFQWLPIAIVVLLVVLVVGVVVRTFAARVDDVFWYAHVIKLAQENWESLQKSSNTMILAAVASSLRAVIKYYYWYLFD